MKQKKINIKKWIIIAVIVLGIGGVASMNDSTDNIDDKQTVNTLSDNDNIASDTKQTEQLSNDTTTEPQQAPEIEVSLDVSVKKNGGKPMFTVKTNLPDEAVLMLTLNGNDYRGQTDAVVKNGVAKSKPYSSDGKKLSSGKYTLEVSMSEPRLQSDNVRAIVGENGENMTGEYVQTTDIDDAKFISGDFKFSFKFKKKPFVKKYATDIVVCSKMFLDQFITDYKVSLATKLWTLADFDKKGAVIALTDVTFKSTNSTEKAMIVFTPELDGNKMTGGTSHYISVGDTVYGDDGYCDDLFSKLEKILE